MNCKANIPCKTVATKNSKNIVESRRQSLPKPEAPVEEVVLLDNCNTLIELTVTTKGRKRSSTMVSSSPVGHKTIEEKRKHTSGDSHHNWGQILREQNRPTVKQSLQQLPMRTHSSKSSKYGSESKESKKHSDIACHQKYEHSHKHLDEIPVKQPASHRRLESNEHQKETARSGNPSNTSMASSMQSILVLDRAVQCGGIFDNNDDKFGVFNPVRTLGFLMKELEHLVKGDKANKILYNMEQALFRIPAESGKSVTQDIEAIALRTKLEASTIQLEETSRKMNAMCEALRNDRDSLQRQVHKQVLMLNEARERQLDLEATIKTLRQELDEATKAGESREKKIAELKEELKGYEFSQKVIADLRENLNEQTELARQRHLEMQYLTLEKDKLSVLSSYKDTLLIELRNAVKELQNHIVEQLSGLKSAYIQEENSNPQMSLVYGGLACSSPTSTSSRDSNVPTSWHDLSAVSLSMVEHHPNEDRDGQNFLVQTDKAVPFNETTGDNIEKKRSKSIKESKIKDSAHLEFISLPGGESSHTIMLPSYKDFGCPDSSQIQTTKGKEDVVSFNKKNDNLFQSKSADVNATSSASSFLHQSGEKINDNETHEKTSQKIRRPAESKKKQNFGKKSTVLEEAADILKSNLSSNLIASSITEQFQNMFEDIRMQSRMPVNVPSPPRNYPNPDWSDSTLPSISAASELNVIQSNDT